MSTLKQTDPMYWLERERYLDQEPIIHNNSERCPNGCPSQYWESILFAGEWVSECGRCGHVEEREAPTS